MTVPLRFFALRSFRNAAARQIRTPRGAAAVVIGAVYAGWMLLGQRPLLTIVNAAWVGRIGAAAAFLASGMAWWQGSRRIALRAPERQWLATAPITSGRVLSFHALGRVPTLLLSAGVLAVILRAPTIFGTLYRGAAIVVVLGVVEAHQLIAAVVAERVDRGIRRAATLRWFVRVGYCGLALAAIAVGVAALFAVQDLAARAAFRAWAQRVADNDVWFAFGPFTVLARGVLEDGGGERMRALGTAILLLAVELAWLARAGIAWPEQAAETRRAGNGRRMFRRAPPSLFPGRLLRGSEFAFAWKNMLTAPRTQRLAPQLALCVAVPLLLWLTATPIFHRFTEFAFGLSSVWGLTLIAAGPMLIRNDLRMDLPRLRLLKSLPLRSRRLLMAESLPAAILLWCFQLVLVSLAWVALAPNPVMAGVGALGWPIVIATIIALAGVNLAVVLCHTLVALWLPSLSLLGVARSSRIRGGGQYYLLLTAALVQFAIIMLLPALVGLIAFGATQASWGRAPAAILAGAAIGMVALAEAMVLVALGGRAFERLNVSEVPRSATG